MLALPCRAGLGAAVTELVDFCCGLDAELLELLYPLIYDKFRGRRAKVRPCLDSKNFHPKVSH